MKGYLGNVETAFAKYESRKKKIEKEISETEGKMKSYEMLESRISPETIYGLLSDLSVLFEDAADLDIAALNRMLRALYARIEIDFDTRTIYPVLVSQS